jgi:hypothetical protein
MKTKYDKVTKGIIFAGCSFTWGQGLYYYSNMPTLKEPAPDSYDAQLVTDAHKNFRKTLYYPRLVANHFDTFEVTLLQNGGSEVTSIDYLKVAFGLMGPITNYITEKYSFDEIEYLVFQTSQPQRNTYYYDYVNKDGSIDKNCEYRHFSSETHWKFYDYLMNQKQMNFDDWWKEHVKNWFNIIKNNLKLYESKGIKTIILCWEADYLPLIKEDKWMLDRFVTFEYNNKNYDCIRTMMNENRRLHINSDYEHFEIPPQDHHPSKECHRIMADAVINKIKETKDKKLKYEPNLI